MNTVILCAVVVTVLGVAIVFLGLMRVGGKRNEHPQRSRRNKVLAIVGIILFASVFASALGMAGRAWLLYQFDNFRGSEAKGDAAWSPDGKRIAFVSRYEGEDNIYVMNTDGSNVTQLTSDPFRYYYIFRDPTDTDPAWSPDGKQIAFVSGRSGSLLNWQALNIYVMDANGSNVVRLTGRSKNSLPSLGYYYTHPAWSPDGKKIAFGYGEAIYVMNADGTSPVKITDVYQFYPSEISPSWSPDGKYITFMEDGANGSDIYIIRTDGSGRRQLTRNFSVSTDPAWSPDGKKIIFAGRARYCADCNLYIYVTNLAGAYPVKLAEYPSENFQYKGHITWSPNGDQVALSYAAIYIMNADGSDLKYLTGIR